MNPVQPSRAKPGLKRLLAGVAIAILMACGAREPSDPVAVAQAFANAVQQRDSKAIVKYLDEATVLALTVRAQRASDQVGGRRTVETWEMLQVDGFDPLRQFSSAELVGDPSDTAVVRLTDNSGQTADLTLVFERETWHVQIPLPPSTP
ncbi:MAG: hypothetical protein ACPG77_14200 [Nannocystaceae bacterium]